MYSEISSKTSRNRHLSVTESITQLEQSFEHRLSDLCYLDACSAVPRLLAVFRKLSDYTNAVAPINGIPPELHRMIFKQATAPRTGDPFHGRSILTLTHVCRLWRDTVVGAASLWCHIDLNAKEPLAALFVQRSSGLPITLHLSTRDEGKLKLMRGILKQHTARVRAIHMDDGCIEPPQAPLPVECFFLRGWLHSPNRTPEWALFNGNTSPLKALSLVVNYVWDWKWMPTNPLPNLTHLYLSSLSHGELRPRYSAESLLRMLSGTSMLQYLHLTSVGLLIDPSKIRNPLPVVRLDHVHTMSIHQSDLEVAFFLLAHLDLPDDILLCIDGARSALPSTPASPYHHALRIPPLGLLGTLTFMELSISAPSFLLAGYNAQSTSGFFIETSRPEISGTLGGTWLEDLHTMIPLLNMTALHVNIDVPKTIHHILPSILPRFTHLQELCLLVTRQRVKPGTSGRRLVERFFRALDPGADALDVVCPALRVLGLEAELAHEDFPFSALESMAASRMRARHRGERFSSSFMPLAAFVDSVEYRTAGEAKPCRFTARDCWDEPEAEKYWPLPSKLWYGLGSDLEQSESGSTTGDHINGDKEHEEVADGAVDAELVG